MVKELLMSIISSDYSKILPINIIIGADQALFYMNYNYELKITLMYEVKRHPPNTALFNIKVIYFILKILKNINKYIINLLKF